MSNQINFKFLKTKAVERRLDILDCCYNYSGHIASSFSCTEILVYLYYHFLKINPKKPNDTNRDLLILSKGHSSELLYSILSDLSFFPINWFKKNFCNGRYILGSHTDSKIPGVEYSAGSVGHGLGIASGISLVKKKNNRKIVVVTGDAELSEGSIWEAMFFIKKNNLKNIIIIIDYNNIGATDFVNNFISLDNLKNKILSFGLKVSEIKKANDFKNLDRTLKKFKNKKNFYTQVFICHTKKGFGFKYFENDPIWHVKKITTNVYERAKKYLLKSI